ncbi:MAG TPA: hypothetical protein PJ997_01525 [Candidatus Paceibacterota bacterium]|mgnify:FL=1|nr:hypothetical protein [Candidatus Paceibacterota bacterium]HMP18999.1 hypothetical protein [Candidatus Paceibacterota bacterium]
MKNFFDSNKKIIIFATILLLIFSPFIQIKENVSAEKNTLSLFGVNSVYAVGPTAPSNPFIAQRNTILNGLDNVSGVSDEEKERLRSDILNARNQSELNQALIDSRNRIGDCGLFGIKCEMRLWFNETIERAGEIILSIFGALLWGAGSILNISVHFGIIKMANLVNSENVYKGWEIIRDLINIALIFGMLYISINTIIKGFSENQKNLASLIFAAIFINFSFFFASVLIDASNLLSYEIYQKISCAESSGSDVTSIANTGISSCFMQQLKLQTIYSIGGGGVNANQGNSMNVVGWTEKSGWDKFKYYILASIFVFAATIVFIGMAIIIIARLITLIMLLILSPVMFLGMIIPSLKTHSSKWTQKFTAALISLPAMFLFLYITFLMIQGNGLLGNSGISGLNTSGTISNAIEGGTGSLGVVLNFAIVLGFLYGSIVIAKETGAAGANFVSKAASGILKGAALGAGFGGVALAGRTIGGGIGAGARRLAKRNPDSAVSRTIGRFGDNLAKRSFDFRNTKAASALGAAGVGLGAGSKRSFDDQVNIAKRVEDYGKKADDSRTKQNLELYGKTDDFEQKRADAEAGAAANAYASVYQNQQFVDNQNKITRAEAENKKAEEEIKALQEAYNTSPDQKAKDQYIQKINAKKLEVSTRNSDISKIKSQSNKILEKELEKTVGAEFKKMGIASKQEIEKTVKKQTMDKDARNHQELMNELKKQNQSSSKT